MTAAIRAAILLSPHFTVGELSKSATAEHLGIDNTPPPDVLTNLGRLAVQLEVVRDALGGGPLVIHSAYRCPALNKAVGGAPNSYHMLGLAADFDPPNGMTHDDAQHTLAAIGGLDYDLIMEEGTAKPESEGGSRWIHFQTSKPGVAGRRLVRDALVDHLGGTILRTSPG